MPTDPERLRIGPDLFERPTGDIDPPRPGRADDPTVTARLDELIIAMGGDPGSFDGRLIRELLQTGLKLVTDGRNTGELKLITSAVKEMRYAYRVFGKYPTPHKVTIFGSARTPPDHPDYTVCVEFSRLMAESGWMIITGAGGGIMQAGHIGPGRKSSFGVAIRLPFETTANEVIAGDEKLINFRYFFTRKLMFLSQAEAVVIFPGGFGTLDELFEVLTLIQTGKAAPMPIVLMEGNTPGSPASYWSGWERFVKEQLLARGLVSPEDPELYHVSSSPRDAMDHITRFYRVYHSSRYVRDDFVIRLNRPISEDHIRRLNQEFAPLIRKGAIAQRAPYEAENGELPDLPRLAFTHTRSKFGLIRKLIDRINEAPPA